MARIRICKHPDCKNAATTSGFCRLHYLKNWKKLKEEEHRKATKKLNRYVERMVKRHPDRYVEMIKKDIRSHRFDKYIEDNFGFGDEESGLFDEPTYDDDVRELIEKLRKDSE